jgi:hypothetical protein
MKYLLIYSGNWSDEIDVDGFIIVDSEFVCYVRKFLKNFNSSISVDIGFNETIEYENGNDLLQEISFEKITNKESETIEKFFGKSNDFGSNLLMAIKQSSSDDDDNEDVFTYEL